MRTSKSLYSRCFEEYRLSDETLKKLQNELLLMLIDVKSVCDSCQINYMLSGGSMLGAVRHQGFIPWDDDIDIMMLRSEYERFKDSFRKAFPDKYAVSEPLSDARYLSKMVKIFKKGTTYVEIPTAGVSGQDMLFLDLFIIENVPAILQTKIFSFTGCFPTTECYLRMCESLGNQRKRTGWLGIPSGISYGREIFPERVFTELTTMSFCGVEVKVPADYDAYLKNLYGNYMELPPEDKREYHAAYKIEF